MNDNLKRIGGVIARSLISKLSWPILLVAALLIILVVVVVASILSSDMGESGKLGGGGKQLSEKVLQWEDDIKESIVENGLDPEHLPVLLAILQQESGGDMIATNGDIFQSSESKCGSIGCITDPLESIDQAVKHFKNNVSKAKGNTEVAIASYNFGNGFADWTQKHHNNEWSRDIAIEFSQHMMDKVPDPENYTCIREEAKEFGACYGDILYVPTIKAFLPNENNPDEKVDFAGDLVMPLTQVIVTSNYGYRLSPGDGVGSSDHKGIDLGCTGGVTPIYSVGAGQVIYSEFNKGGYGNSVIVKHEDGFYTHYAHMSMLDVDQEDYVQEGTQLGVCGSTGDSTGPHLHFETKSEQWGGHMNPRDFLDFPAQR
ncbi:lysozyme family protein [Thalassobacillus sp. B23F22_16]|uniref:lysozyme family protein n=1 Tax=Thalassobacillus sp. B23F22_16 TaxID=3459513 RepID=UPI00373F397C